MEESSELHNSLVTRMRGLRDRLQGIPLRLGLPSHLESITIIRSAPPYIPEGSPPDSVPLTSETVTTGIVAAGPISAGSIIKLSSSGIQVDKTMITVVLSSSLNSMLSDPGLCRFYFDGIEWLPVHIKEDTLATEVTLRKQTDTGWGPYG